VTPQNLHTLLARTRAFYWRDVREAFFLVGLAATSVTQLIIALDLRAHPRDADAAQTIAVLVIVCFLFGIGHAWELAGGPSIGLGHEVAALVRGDDRIGDSEEADD
jgi:hypothetical protein